MRTLTIVWPCASPAAKHAALILAINIIVGRASAAPAPFNDKERDAVVTLLELQEQLLPDEFQISGDIHVSCASCKWKCNKEP